jgi:ribonuclease HI
MASNRFKKKVSNKGVKEALKQNPYIIYTDGACKGNPGPGGYGIVAIYDGIVVKLSKGYYMTTNNRQEILGVIAALEEFGPGKHFIICTDSQYVIDGATNWLRGWIRNNWVTYQAQTPVKNADLWKIMDELLKLNKVTFHKVAGHAGDPFNEMADELAVEAAANPTTIDEEYKPLAGTPPVAAA